MDNRLGWILMELPAFVVCPLLYVIASSKLNAVAGIMVGLWAMHYFNRTVIFPLRTKTTGKRIPIAVVAMAIAFNGVNGALNGYFFAKFASYETSWLWDPRFVVGALLFGLGLFINVMSDKKLIALRTDKHDGYKIPKGWLFRYISCPNHGGEVLEWCGFAIMAWSLPALSFAVWTAANLLPRAYHHHLWYRETFSDYPAERKAVIPKLL